MHQENDKIGCRIGTIRNKLYGTIYNQPHVLVDFIAELSNVLVPEAEAMAKAKQKC